MVVIMIKIMVITAKWGDNVKNWGDKAVSGHDPELSIDNLRRQLKTFLFAQY